MDLPQAFWRVVMVVMGVESRLMLAETWLSQCPCMLTGTAAQA